VFPISFVREEKPENGPEPSAAVPQCAKRRHGQNKKPQEWNLQPTAAASPTTKRHVNGQEQINADRRQYTVFVHDDRDD
jgi:hypothetical protein